MRRRRKKGKGRRERGRREREEDRKEGGRGGGGQGGREGGKREEGREEGREGGREKGREGGREEGREGGREGGGEGKGKGGREGRGKGGREAHCTRTCTSSSCPVTPLASHHLSITSLHRVLAHLSNSFGADPMTLNLSTRASTVKATRRNVLLRNPFRCFGRGRPGKFLTTSSSEYTSIWK